MNMQKQMNGPKETVKSFAQFLLPHFKYLAFNPISPHMAYLDLGVKKLKKIVLKILKFPRKEQMVILNCFGKKLMRKKTMVRKFRTFSADINLGEVIRPHWLHFGPTFLPAFNLQDVSQGLCDTQ